MAKLIRKTTTIEEFMQDGSSEVSPVESVPVKIDVTPNPESAGSPNPELASVEVGVRAFTNPSPIEEVSASEDSVKARDCFCPLPPPRRMRGRIF